MTYGKAIELLKLKNKKELAEVLNITESYMKTLAKNDEMTPQSNKIVELLIQLKTEKTSGLKEGDWIVISCSFYEDEYPRAYKLLKEVLNGELYVYDRDEKLYLSSIPKHLIIVGDKRQFENQDIFL